MDIIQQIESKTNELSRSQRAVANLILKDPMQTAFSTIAQIAYAADVSTATVIRLAESLGYSGFTDFQNALKGYLRTMSAPVNMFSLSNTDSGNPPTGDYVDKLLETEISNIYETFHGLDKEELEAAAEVLRKAEHIYVCGARNCEGVAIYAAYNFNRMFLNASVVDVKQTSLPEWCNALSSKDVLIVIDFSRYIKVLSDMVTIASGKGAKIICITDSVTSPHCTRAAHSFFCKNNSINFHHSMVTATCVIDILLKKCTQLDAKRVQSNLEKLEDAIGKINLFTK